MKCLVLDAMGVIFSAADDVAELLIPFIAEHGGSRVVRCRKRLRRCHNTAALKPPPGKPMNKTGITALLASIALVLAGPGAAQQGEAEIVSFRCVLALDAVLAELDRQAENVVIKEALERIDEERGEFVCGLADAETIVVRLQSPDLAVTEGKLVFTVDPVTYRVLKTYFGP